MASSPENRITEILKSTARSIFKALLQALHADGLPRHPRVLLLLSRLAFGFSTLPKMSVWAKLAPLNCRCRRMKPLLRPSVSATLVGSVWTVSCNSVIVVMGKTETSCRLVTQDYPFFLNLVPTGRDLSRPFSKVRNMLQAIGQETRLFPSSQNPLLI